MSGDLLKKLREQLPPDCFEINNETLATYYDYHRVSTGRTKADQGVIEGYVTEVISEKIGYPVRIVPGEHVGYGQPGYFVINFERASPIAIQK